MGYTLNEKQLAQIDQGSATERVAWNITSSFKGPSAVDGYHQTLVFHKAVGLPVRDDWSYIPPVSERLLRGRLLLEEMLETLNAMGLTLVANNDAEVVDTHIINGVEYAEYETGVQSVELVHIEGSVYDPIETADGLADIKVIANGTALCFGIPMKLVDNEVFASNMSKLDVNGEPIVNQCPGQWDMDDPMKARCCNFWAQDQECTDDSHLIDPTQPRGKILKPETYVKANITRLYVDSTRDKGDE